MAKDFKSVAPSLLLATPPLQDPNFKQTVVLMFHHSPEGALGLVINRPSRRKLGELLDIINMPTKHEELRELPVLVGGPVSPGSGWLIFEGEDHSQASFVVEEGLLVTGAVGVLREILDKGPTGNLAFLLGYAGWGPMQLDHELALGAWLVAPLDRELLFSVPYEERWRRAYLSLGIDPNLWSTEIGEG